MVVKANKHSFVCNWLQESSNQMEKMKLFCTGVYCYSICNWPEGAELIVTSSSKKRRRVWEWWTTGEVLSGGKEAQHQSINQSIIYLCWFFLHVHTDTNTHKHAQWIKLIWQFVVSPEINQKNSYGDIISMLPSGRSQCDCGAPIGTFKL